MAETRVFPKDSTQELLQESHKESDKTTKEGFIRESLQDSANTTNPLPNSIFESDTKDITQTQETIKDASPNTQIQENPQAATTEEGLEQENPAQESGFLQDSAKGGNLLVKNVYLELLNPLVDILYVHQIVALDLKMLVFSKYTTIKTEFIFDDESYKDSVEVLNPNDNWALNAEDSSLRNTFYLKIKQPHYMIPQIKVRVDTSDGEAVESIKGTLGKAIKLERKGEFSQVLAQNLEILDTKITSYDANSNLAVLQLQSTMGNLFDFHLESYTQQGIESKNGDYQKAVAFYYAIIPKSASVMTFDYFNTTTSKYQTLQVQNIVSEERISTQSDIKPKNNYQFFKIALILFFLLLFLGLYFYKRKFIFAILAFVALCALVYFLTLKTSVILKKNAALRIQPSFNSTIVFTAQEPMSAEIIGERNQYYKVILKDDRIGWIKKDDVQD